MRFNASELSEWSLIPHLSESLAFGMKAALNSLHATQAGSVTIFRRKRIWDASVLCL